MPYHIYRTSSIHHCRSAVIHKCVTTEKLRTSRWQLFHSIHSPIGKGSEDTIPRRTSLPVVPPHHQSSNAVVKQVQTKRGNDRIARNGKQADRTAKIYQIRLPPIQVKEKCVVIYLSQFPRVRELEFRSLSCNIICPCISKNQHQHLLLIVATKLRRVQWPPSTPYFSTQYLNIVF